MYMKLSVSLTIALLACPSFVTASSDTRPTSLKFDTFGYITAVNSSDFNFGTNDFTISAWFKIGRRRFR